MHTENHVLEILSDRVERLERENRFFRRAGLLTSIILCSAVLIAQVQAVKVTPPKAATSLEAGKFILQDGRGQKKAELGLFADRPVLVFYDDAANPTLSVGVEAEGSGLTIYDRSSEKAAVLNYGSNGPVLSLFQDGQKRLNLSITTPGPAVGLLGKKGEAKAAFALTADDDPFIHLFGPGERGGAQLLAASDRTALRFFDATDRARAVFGIVDKESSPGLVLNDSNGIARSILMLTSEGPGLEFYDQNRFRIWSAK